MEKKGTLEPHQIPDGFYGKRPLSRIKVALSGPIVNIVFAFFAFCLLWTFGGRSKPFSEYTHLVGSVDPSSGIYAIGVRPGDEIQRINDRPFHNFQDLLFAGILENTPPMVSGLERNYLDQTSAPFQYRFDFAQRAPIAERLHALLYAMRPATYLIYNKNLSLSLNQNSPMQDTGIQDGDRILWVDGEVMFSKDQLVQTINQPRALLTIQREGKIWLARVPRLKISDLRLNPQQKAEIEDWQHEARIKGKPSALFFIPYNLTNDCLVESALSYLNEETVEQHPLASARSMIEIPLKPGDHILAVDGIPVHSSYEMMDLLQSRHIQIIVKRDPPAAPVTWKDADKAFLANIHWDALNQIIQSIGTQNVLKEVGNLKLLNPVTPKPWDQLSIPEEKKEAFEAQYKTQLKQAEEIKDPRERAQAMQMFEQERHKLKLGIVMLDDRVNYNPSPVVLFGSVLKETWKTIVALFTGTVSPKYMTGPVGIVQVMQQSWGSGFKEALFWLGMISMNLGILNLLPIPVLDGGHICFSLWEWITGKPIKAKTMERLIIPFVILLIALFIYLTYNDLMRLFSGFFN
jgi:regulator of sigma E protease